METQQYKPKATQNQFWPWQKPKSLNQFLKYYLANYQNKILANKLLFWISVGFQLHYFDPIIRIESSNLISVYQHHRKTMKKKCQRNQIRYVWETLWEIAFSNLTVSPKGVVPKGDDAGKRLIAYLSFPTGNSIIEFIDPADSTVHNSSIDPVVHMLAKAGKEVCIARWILSHLSDCYLFISEILNKLNKWWLKWKESVTLTSAPMCCFISCKLFWRICSTFLQSVVDQRTNFFTIDPLFQRLYLFWEIL